MGKVSKSSGISITRAAIVLTVALGVGTGFGGVLGAGTTFAATMPSPVVVTCGEVITTSITVANNLTCPGDALTIQADGVTLDLGGHTIRGSGSGLAVNVDADPNEPQITDVTITNGTIAGFGTAVHFVDTVNATLSSLLLTGDGSSTTPVIDTGHSAFTDNLQITDTRIVHNNGYVMFAQIQLGSLTMSNSHVSDGKMFLSQTGGPTFTGDTFTNAPLTLDIVGGATVTGSKFVNSPVVNDGFGFGHDVFQNNKFTGTATGTALKLADVPEQQVSGNTFSGNDIGVSLSDSPNDTISGNIFSHNSTAGIYFVDNSGPLGSGTLSVSGNTAKYNGTSPDGTIDPGGVAVEGGIFLYTPRGGATITDNMTAHNGGYGIYALPPTPGTGTNTSSGNVSTDDFGKCYPLNTCTY